MAKPYLTPNAPLPAEKVCFRLRIPNDLLFIGAVKTALLFMISEWTWDEYGTATPAECARAALDMYNEFAQDEGWCMLGAIYPYASANAPDNTLPCDGSSHLRVDYPILYAALDTAFIVDSDHFITPDLRGRVAVGAGGALAGFGTLAVGQTGGEAQHQLTTAELASHSHTTNPHTHSEVTAAASAVTVGLEPPVPSAVPSVGITGGASPTTNATGGDAAHNNVQPFMALKYCIVAR